MPDQAADLRRLFQEGARPLRTTESGPRTLVVSGGRPGVGATTLTVNLAVALASDAQRVVLIDADLYRADVAARCGLSTGPDIGEVLMGRKSIHEVLQLGPGGLQVLAGSASAETRSKISDRTTQRLLRQMQSLGPHVDWLVVDAGNQPADLAARLWSEARDLLLVTSPDAVAVMDTYALLKTQLAQAPGQSVSLVVNHANDSLIAADVHRRIDRSCQRFLGSCIDFAGAIPFEPESNRSSVAVLAEPLGKLALAVAALCRRLQPAPTAAYLHRQTA